MRIERHKNFLSPVECQLLNEWADMGVKNKWLGYGISRGDLFVNRFTTRIYAYRFEYPQIVLDVSDRVRKFCSVDNYPLIEGHGRNGVVVSSTHDGGDVYKHKDSRPQGKCALRCNIMTRGADSGGRLYVGGEPLDIEVGELHCYLASEFEHEVTVVNGSTPRVLWMFGAAVPFEDWENGEIKFGLTEAVN